VVQGQVIEQHDDIGADYGVMMADKLQQRQVELIADDMEAELGLQVGHREADLCAHLQDVSCLMLQDTLLDDLG
jgi:hypothetical protein